MPDELAGQLLALCVGVVLGVIGVIAARRLLGGRPTARPAVPGDGAPGRRAAPPSDGIGRFADGLGVGLIELDAERVVRSANESAHRLLDRPAGTLAGLSAMAAFIDHRIDDLLARAGREPVELEVARVGEPERTLLVGAQRSGPGWLLVVRDVSELRRLQRIRSEFIDNLAHELRTPLTTIRLLTETLSADAESAALPARVRDRIAKVDAETAHLVQTVNELLDLSRIEAGAGRLQLESVDPAAIIAGSLERLRAFADRQGVALVTEQPPVAGRLPLVRADAERLGHVLLNLLHNAVKFSPAGSTVTVAAEARAGELAVAVSDEGIGIPRADLDRVFERFYKVDRARSRGEGGTGLGLAIARHIVDGHGGRIWVDSREGRGSTFTFTVPLADPPPDARPSDAQPVG